MTGSTAVCIDCKGPADLANLLRAIANGDDVAFGRFRRATLGKVMSTALSVVHDHHAAEDVTQVVFLIVWKQAGTFHGVRGGPISWLSAITRNRSLDYLRTQARRTHDTLEEVSELHDPSPTPYELTERSNAMAVALDRLNSLPAAEKGLLLSAIVKEVPYPVLARTENIPLSTLKSKVRRAMIKLSLEPDCEPWRCIDRAATSAAPPPASQSAMSDTHLSHA